MNTSQLISLDDAGAAAGAGPGVSPGLVGAKAASLARARRAGLPVLPGWVVTTAAARPALSAGAAAIRSGGTGPGRRAVLAHSMDRGLADGLVRVASDLGGRVIVRSSSPLEDDPRWSGAFSSVAEVGPGDMVTAVRSVWASAFAVDPLRRLAGCGLDPDDLDLAVLVQPEIRPEAGGTARVTGDGVAVEGIRGHPGPMLAGWAEGASARVRDGSAEGGLPDLIGTGTVLAVAALARAAARALCAGLIEWATADGQVYLLQASESGLQAHGDGLQATEDGLRATRDGAPAGAAAPPGPVPSVPGRPLACRPVTPGYGAGRLVWARPHESLPLGAGDVVLLIDRPVPALAPLLFAGRADRAGTGGAGAGGAGAERAGPGGAVVRGVVCRRGPDGSHLAEVARALGVPMVIAPDLDPATVPEPCFTMVDASDGRLTLCP
jgi:Pyruvate phosphate dikinase, AMP/ATP-binding domain